MIRGIVAQLNPVKLKAGMLVLIDMVLESATPEFLSKFEEAAKSHRLHGMPCGNW